MAGKQVSGDNLAANLAGMSKNQLYDIMCQMKSLIEQNQHQARQILIQNPLLTRALFQAQIMLGMVQPSQTPQSSYQASPPAVQQSNARGVHSTPSQVVSQDQANVSQTHVLGKQKQNQPSMPISSTFAQAIHSQSVPLQSVEQPRGHVISQASQISHPQSSQVPNMPSLPLHSGSPSRSVHQPPMPGHLQQPMQTTGVSHHMIQPPLPPQPRPPVQMQYQPSVGPNVNSQSAGIPPMHHSQPLFHSGGRPSGTGPFHQGQPPPMNQTPHQPMYQGGGSNLGTDYNKLGGNMMQMERGAPWPPASRDNSSGAQLPTLPPLAPGPMPVGNQARPPPLTPDVEQALLQQVMSLTPEQINLLPPEQRHQVLQLQQMLRH